MSFLCRGFRRTRAQFALTVVLALAFAAGHAPAFAAESVHHRLQVALEPGVGRISVEDTVTLPATSSTSVRFSLARAFEPRVQGGRLTLVDEGGPRRFRTYRLDVDEVPAQINLTYAGPVAETMRRAGHGMPLAVLDDRGAYLDAAAGWYPRFEQRSMTFDLHVEAPAGWLTLSQGERLEQGRHWRTRVPQDDIYLLAGPFERYARSHRGYELSVYLLAPDAGTAQSYLDVMGQYVDLYSALIAEYPYPKFAVVENRWQTGYGMPSFTLLGSRVLRLPFILHSSLPHEILHNWWGNGVYVDYQGGNWSEGLTAYLADHLIREAQGEGARYRRQALERYANFAAEGRDFPLRAFRGRHDDASQAVGYGKAMMLFHMTRGELGDAAFVAGLKAFWEAFRYQQAGFADLRGMFEQTAGTAVHALADAWLDRPGAPRLVLEDAARDRSADGGWVIRLRLRQAQAGAPFPLRVPVAVQFADGQAPQWRHLVFDGREAHAQWRFEREPARLDVDPGYEVFRLLDDAERPASLGRMFGARVQLLVLPADAPAGELAAWRGLAEAWERRYDNVRVRLDRELDRLPEDEAVWLLGWDNRWLARLTHRFAGVGQEVDARALTVAGERFPRGDYAVVALDSDTRRAPLGFVGAPAQAVPGLARKLPHYGNYGRPVFRGQAPDNVLRQDLPAAHSPLTRVLGSEDPGPPGQRSGPLSALVGVPLRFD